MFYIGLVNTHRYGYGYTHGYKRADPRANLYPPHGYGYGYGQKYLRVTHDIQATGKHWTGTTLSLAALGNLPTWLLWLNAVKRCGKELFYLWKRDACYHLSSKEMAIRHPQHSYFFVYTDHCTFQNFDTQHVGKNSFTSTIWLLYMFPKRIILLQMPFPEYTMAHFWVKPQRILHPHPKLMAWMLL